MKRQKTIQYSFPAAVLESPLMLPNLEFSHLPKRALDMFGLEWYFFFRLCLSCVGIHLLLSSEKIVQLCLHICFLTFIIVGSNHYFHYGLWFSIWQYRNSLYQHGFYERLFSWISRACFFHGRLFKFCWTGVKFD